MGGRWRLGGRGPYEFDCWGVLCFAYKKLHGIDLPEWGCNAQQSYQDNAKMLAKEMVSAVSAGDWTEISAPREGCAVAMSTGCVIHHVGVFTQLGGGTVVHALPSGVFAHSLASLPGKGWKVVRFYVHKDQPQ